MKKFDIYVDGRFGNLEFFILRDLYKGTICVIQIRIF
jgi:hypothetical protein